MDRYCALAFLEAALSSPKVRAHLGAVLGRKGVPTIDDFDTDDVDACERCDHLVGYLDAVYSAADQVQKTRGRQKELYLDRPSRKEAPASEAGENGEPADRDLPTRRGPQLEDPLPGSANEREAALASERKRRYTPRKTGRVRD